MGSDDVEFCTSVLGTLSAGIENCIDIGIGVCGVVVKKNECFNVGLNGPIGGCGCSSVSPADFVRVFVIGVLGISDKNIGVSNKIDVLGR